MFKQLYQYFAKMASSKLIKGLELAVMGSIATAIGQAIQNHALPVTLHDWQVIGTGALLAGGTYLMHNVPGVIAPAQVIIATETKTQP